MTRSSAELFADKLNLLLDRSAARSGVAMSLSQFVTDLENKTGVTISKAYLAALRKGQAPEPRLDVVRGLAEYFNVGPSFFFDQEPADADSVSDEMMHAMKRAGVRRIGLRAADLSDQSLSHIISIIDNIRALEGLTPVGDEDEDAR
ncbi:transcriptional regulator [Nocardia sp. NPDC052566]|uniref:transcriptional regulator n=1 Tax=Nocardia sp. NPDC052566 TaxID=3364330 RepID=UPI0037C7EB16